MTRYILNLNFETSDRALFSVLMEKIQAMVNDCKPEEANYTLGQLTREEGKGGI